MVKTVCVLRSGGDYRPEHVQWLARQVPGITCMSDTPVEGVDTIDLKYDWPGWWSKMELFRPDIEGDLLFFDLDTVVFCDPSDLIQAANGKTTMLSDFLFPRHPASGLMYIAQKDKAKVWDAWNKDPQGHMKHPEGRGTKGDQGFLGRIMPDVQRWQDVTGGIYGYNSSVKRTGLPKGAKLVCFFGNPRPWQAGKDWVPALY